MMSNNLLKSPVGKNGKNLRSDTDLVIILLNKHIQRGALNHLRPLRENMKGDDPAVIKAIEEYQKKVLKYQNPDGRVDPGGKTIRSLKQTPKDPIQTLFAINKIVTNVVQGPPGEGIDDNLWSAGMLHMLHHINHSRLRRYDVITLVDFRKSIREKRLWVVNLDSRIVLEHVHVAHGSGSGGAAGIPTNFEDVEGSHKSNIGGYVTLSRAKSSAGHLDKWGLPSRGLSLIIDGLDPTNSKTKARQIIFHGATYMNPYGSHGKKIWYGRSWGCFATHPSDNTRIIHLIDHGSYVYSYAGDDKKP
jgi:hypothetical protein